MLATIRRWVRARMLRSAFDVDVRRVDRAAVRQQPLSDDWRLLVARGLPQYLRLDTRQRDKLGGDLQIFAAEKHLVGEGDFEIDDPVRVTIAATAALLVLGLDIAAFDHVVKISVRREVIEADGDRIAAGQYQPAHHPLIGRFGMVHLVWPEVMTGIARPDGNHVVIHELAHALDHDLDLLGTHPDQPRWRAALDQFPLHRFQSGNYMVTNVVADVEGPELFAVASELFFERPRTLHDLAPTLFERLREIYNLDPRTFT